MKPLILTLLKFLFTDALKDAVTVENIVLVLNKAYATDVSLGIILKRQQELARERIQFVETEF